MADDKGKRDFRDRSCPPKTLRAARQPVGGDRLAAGPNRLAPADQNMRSH